MRGFVSIWVALALVSCNEPSSLSPFASDEVSLIPDRSLLNADDWCSCCFEHDVSYWRGGTEAEREAARADELLESYYASEMEPARGLPGAGFQTPKHGLQPAFILTNRIGPVFTAFSPVRH